jgi:hypothetical protein
LTNYNTDNSDLSNNNVWKIELDPDGSKWFGTENGVSVILPGGFWENYNTDNSDIAGNYINAIGLDKNGSKWFGTIDGGVSVLNQDGSWTNFNTQNSGIADDKVNDIAIDSDGSVWIATGEGLSVFSQSKDEIHFNLHLDPAKEAYSAGDSFSLLLDLQALSKNTSIDLYFVLLNVNTNTLYYGLLWDITPAAVLTNFTLPANITLTDAVLMNITVPSQKPPVSNKGTYAFAIGASTPGTFDFISNIASVGFVVK